MARRIYGKSIETGVILNFESIKSAQTDGGFDRTSIQHCLSGRARQHKGYTWHYVPDLQ